MEKGKGLEPINPLGVSASDAGISSEQIQRQLERILSSTFFVQSERLRKFLSLAVEMTLEGKKDQLKEYLIGTEVYGRGTSYDPSQDSIVRTEARRLRMKLKNYYETAGRHDPIFIYFRSGTYVPLFRHNEFGHIEETSQAKNEPLIVEGRGVALAVIPFVDLSGSRLSAAFARGLTDELYHVLTQTDGIRVASASSVAQAMAGPWNVPSLIAQLGVVLLLEGTVREENGKLRIGIRVVYSDGFPSTSHRFETLAEESYLSTAQEQIAAAFVSRARPEQSAIRKRTASAGSLILSVYPLLIRAETLLDEGTAAELQEARLKFQEGIDLAPTFARPYCGLAMCLMEMALRGVSPSRELITRAQIAAQKAVALDPEMFASYATLACAQALDWKWDDAEENFTKASNLGVHAPTSREFSLFLLAMGRVDDGIRHQDIAQRIDPFSNRQKIARWKAFHLTRQFREAEAAYNEPLRWGPLPVESHLYMALIYAHMDKPHRALEIIERIRPENHLRLPLLASIAEISASCGLIAEAQKTVAEFNLFASDTPISNYRKALLAIALQQPEQSLSFLQKAVEAHEAEMVWMKMDPRFDSLRCQPEFARIQSTVFLRA